MARYSKTKKSGRLSRKYNNKKYNNKMTGGGDKKGTTKSKSPSSKSPSLRNRATNRAANRAANRVAMPVEGDDLNILDILRARPRLITNEPTTINTTQNHLVQRNVNLGPTTRSPDKPETAFVDNRFSDPPVSFNPFVDNRLIEDK